MLDYLAIRDFGNNLKVVNKHNSIIDLNMSVW